MQLFFRLFLLFDLCSLVAVFHSSLCSGFVKLSCYLSVFLTEIQVLPEVQVKPYGPALEIRKKN